MKQKIADTFRIVILALILSTVIGYSFAAWVPPPTNPPFGNTPPPINVGPATQQKNGNLFLTGLFVANKAQTVSTVASDSGTTLVTKDYVDGRAGDSLRICAENDPCSGTPILCGAHAPDGAATVMSPRHPIRYGSWSNGPCGTSGTGWYSRISTCSTGSGSGHSRCLWVLTKAP